MFGDTGDMNSKHFTHAYVFRALVRMAATDAGGIRVPWELPAYSFRLVFGGYDLGVALGDAGESDLVPGAGWRELTLRFWAKDAWRVLQRGSLFELRYGERRVGEGRIVDRVARERVQ